VVGVWYGLWSHSDGAQLSDDGFRHYVKTVLSPPPLPQASTGGSVMAIFEKFATELGGGYYCKSGISIADIALFNMVDCHLPLFPLHMNAFPALLAHHAKIQAEQGPENLAISRVVPFLLSGLSYSESKSS
jgi:glutathione S-transferase